VGVSDTAVLPLLEVFSRLDMVQTALQVLRQSTKLRVAVVAHVTEVSWTACAVLGETSFGLKPGDNLPLETTFCNTVRHECAPLLINNAAAEPRFLTHPARSLYGVESYIAVPINRRDGSFFGVLCALDAEPAQLSDTDFEIFYLLADLIAFELEASEQQQKQAADLRALEDFIAIAVHDLRQPLTTVLGRAQLLARQMHREKLSPSLLTSATTLVTQARRAVLLSETLLDMAHMEAGSFVLNLTEFDLVALARDVLDDIRMTASGYQLVLEAPESALIYADKSRLFQVLRNLVDNAVKYTQSDAGPIVLSIDTSQSEGVQLSVIDSGQGIGSEELPLLFARRFRAANAVGQGISGSGLGLYIVRTIIEAHGGTIRAELTASGGLAIIFFLPYAEGDHV
jgi:signal transduction histidine kinase